MKEIMNRPQNAGKVPIDLIRLHIHLSPWSLFKLKMIFSKKQEQNQNTFVLLTKEQQQGSSTLAKLLVTPYFLSPS